MRPLIFFVLVSLTAGGLWWYLSAPPPAPRPETPPEGKAKMESLSLTDIEKGGKRWKLNAEKAEYLANRDEIRIQKIYLEFYGDKDQEVVRLWAEEGLVNPKKREVAVKGGVKLMRGDITLHTAEIQYLPKERVLVAPEEVVLQGPRVQMTGKNLSIDLAKRRLVLKDHGLTTVKMEKGLL
ncbi:MAG: LPS export ABC transporter periplasmic protein LptC [Desulfobaccales bacterium]